MTVRRALATASAALLLLVSLTACFGGPLIPTNPNPGTGGGTTTDLTGTTWSGTDSDGDFWAFEFQSDGTVGLTYNSDTYDDATDTWVVAGGTLTITTVFDQGDVVMTGPVSESSIALDGSYPGGTYTLTITPN